MIEGLTPYPAYKESGLPWIGKVPAHWEVLRTKYLLRETDERSQHGLEKQLSMSQIRGLVETSQIERWRMQSESHVGGKLCKANDLVLNRLKAHLGVFAHASQDGLVSPDYTVFRLTRNDEVRFFELLLKTPQYIRKLRASTKGIVEGFWRLYTEDFHAIQVGVPPVSEQRAILDWIDRIDGKIRRLIRLKARQMKLMTEHRQAVIHNAVTQGFKPNAPLKPSGVDWLGNLPEQWQVRRLKYLIRDKLAYGANEAAEYTNTEWPRYIRITDFRADGSLRANTFRSLPPNIANDYLVEPGDVLFARSGATVGKAFLVSELSGLACHAGYLIRARPDRSKVLPEFLFAFTQSAAFQLWKDSTFNIATIQNIGADKYANLELPVPSIAEQRVILNKLEKVLLPIKLTAERAEREIALLFEYRTRLVSEAITGRIDVCKAATLLPFSDEPEPLEEAETVHEDVYEGTGPDTDHIREENEV